MMAKKSILYSLILSFGLSHCGPKEDKSSQSGFKLDIRDYIKEHPTKHHVLILDL